MTSTRMNHPEAPMNKSKFILNSVFRPFAVVAVAALLFGAQPASAQSIGCKVVTNSINGGGIDNGQGDSMLPEEVAGVPQYAQSNWNNFSRYGSGTFMLTNSLGTAQPFNLQWDSGYSDTTGTATGLGTPDGKLMDAFMISWGPGNATPLGNSCYNSPINDKPLAYISGLYSWWTGIPNAEGYAVVLYTTGNSYYETAEGYIESVTGSPLNNTMVEGADLTPHLFEVDTSVYTGTYIPTTGTSSGSPTYGANYMLFTGLTNDAILLRLQSHGYGAGLNAFQFVPVFPAPPTPDTPAFTPSSPVYAMTPVAITETATGDPFHPQLWYQWFSDNGTGGAVTNAILNATNSTYNVTPTNSATTYNIQYLVVVSNIVGAATSQVATLTVNPAVAPFVTQDTTPGPGAGETTAYAYAGGSISFSAAFGGTPPTYLWQSNSVNIPGATSTNLMLNNLPLSASANYQLTATNTVGGASSTPAPLVVLADPPAPDASTAYPNDVFTNNPVAYWRFNETNDNAANYVQAYDYSGHNHDATYGTGAYDNQAGPQSPAFVGFESTNTGVTLLNNINNSYLTAPSLNLNTNAVTITAWINPSGAIGANWGLFMWRGANGDAAGLEFGSNVTNGVAELGYVWNSNSPSTYGFHSGLFPPLGQWSFVALTITPASSTLYLYYIDQNAGVTNLFKATQAITNQAEAFSGGTIWIGSDSNIGRNFNGSIDEVAVFNKSLSEAQVQDLFLKAIGATCIAPVISDATVYPAASVYSGQSVRLSAQVSGTTLSLKWQSSPDGATWTDVPGATSSGLLVNPQTVGTVYYHLLASNCTTKTNNPAAVTFNALPSTPSGLWTVNYQVTNNVISYGTGGGVGYYGGRGILGSGGYWNVLPDTAGAFGYVYQITSASDLRDDGVTHSGIYCSVFNSAGFGSATAVQPDSSDIGNLLYQWVTCYSATNALQFHGLADGTYNLCLYGCDGSFSDRGTTFLVHDSRNGNQIAGTTNASPIVPLQEWVNFVVFTNVHVGGGTLNVDIGPTPVVPQHTNNTEADFNGVQLQLVSYDVPPPAVTLNSSATLGAGGSTMNLSWAQGILETSTNVTGPWVPIYSPSPVTVPVVKTNVAQFFRVRVE